MKKKLSVLVLACVAVAGAFTLPSTFARSSVTAEPMRLERHPAIHKAIAALEDARAEMKAAANDYGGHKAAAMEEVDKAITQLRICDEFNK